MKPIALGLALSSIVIAGGCAQIADAPEPVPVPRPVEKETEVTDPWLWLEEIDDPRALAWVREQNERTRRELASTPMFEEMYAEVLRTLNASSRIPSLTMRGDRVYNLWKSAEHPRGVYRRTTIERLRSGDPRWTTVLDLDELSRREGRPWVFKGMTCLPPEHRRCLVSLSEGGGDAVEVREFDAETLRFVEGGFFLPSAKSSVSWVDADTLFVGTDFGPGSLTESGYPREVRLWRRGRPLASAVAVYEAPAGSVSASAWRIRMPQGHLDVVTDATTFWTHEFHLLENAAAAAAGREAPRLRKLALPKSAVVEDGFAGRLVVRLMEEWRREGRTLREGSVIVADPAALTGGEGAVDVLVEPAEGAIVESVEVTDESVWVTMLDQVRGRLYRFTPTAGGWTTIPLPDNGAVSVMTAQDESGDALVTFESFITPPTLYLVEGRARAPRPEAILSQEATFDGAKFEVSQEWAVSRDGTRVPYFVVAPRGMRRDGSNPTHIFSYGGFRNALTPSYSGSYEPLYGAYGKLWLERGGVFVLANIRGGGEFGPAWHAAALKENRPRSFEDFEAVAEDLVRRGIARPEKIGIEGRSNGGLLTLATMIRRPDLYGAVIAGVPLADMRRYHRLLAGASWMAEYGNPDVPAEWAFLSEYSPYQNLSPAAEYPPLLVYTSTRDDRVHPGHARKIVAKMLEQGHEVWYWENLEGGHGGASTNEQLAYRVALSYAHLWRALDAR